MPLREQFVSTDTIMATPLEFDDVLGEEPPEWSRPHNYVPKKVQMQTPVIDQQQTYDEPEQSQNVSGSVLVVSKEISVDDVTKVMKIGLVIGKHIAKYGCCTIM